MRSAESVATSRPSIWTLPLALNASWPGVVFVARAATARAIEGTSTLPTRMARTSERTVPSSSASVYV
jgi:hypothetical protein